MLSFGVLIAFLSPKQSEIEESSLGIHGKRCPDRASGQDGGGTWVVARLAHIKSMIQTTYPDRI